ncbi:PilZ domain-containing protein [Idiomarina sp. HP20-50]|uniref:PilZ domain-containing protein n=1 Tax=Idiomarina sp. HP20-50 TaxID=3070813 RepID=UPI00294AA7E3|nr:PilZ domain-containing protein [Idiomarina sp. HP20-50]MDV6315244.1 PilZ domain-containing protein [Idiomarina sp. HP20-50]
MLESRENRHFMRMAVNANVTAILTKNGRKQQVNGICLDLSAEGISLKLPTAAGVGEVLLVEVATSGSVAPLNVTAEVVRSEQLNDNSGDFILGCRIVSMD